MSEENILTELNKEEEMKLQSDVMGFIDKNLRPTLVMDGGDITIHEFVKQTNNKYHVLVELMGACSSCPASSMTMKMGVERMVVQNFDYIETVIQINSGMMENFQSPIPGR